MIRATTFFFKLIVYIKLIAGSYNRGMNLRMLKYLVALDEFRHFSRAAEHCHVSQPTMSSQIRKLEERLGTNLVGRHPRRIMMTPTGEKVVARARVILQETENIRTITRS